MNFKKCGGKAVSIMAVLLFLWSADGGLSLSQADSAKPQGIDIAVRGKLPAALWSKLLQRSPYPHTFPLPPRNPTAIDGTYSKVDPKKLPQVPCRRCPDYVPEGGIWKLQFDKGVFRIFHTVSRWKTIGSYHLEKNRLLLYNDPVCHERLGVYDWALEENQLVLKAIKDECKIRLRAKNLTKQPWKSCTPPNTEAAITGHWPVPPGCE